MKHHLYQVLLISSKFNKQRYYKKIRIVDRKMLNLVVPKYVTNTSYQNQILKTSNNN